MPSHPDRVRRNYHDISLKSYEVPSLNEIIIGIHISKLQIATLVSKREVRHEIHRMIINGVENNAQLR